MVRSVTVKQIQELDRLAIEDYGVPSLALMENAGREVAREVAGIRPSGKKRVCVVCGQGNNAGDGFVAARHLWNMGVDVDVVLIGHHRQLKNDAAVNLSILKNCGYPVRETTRITPTVRRTLQKADVIVDAIFGVGLNREVCTPFREFIEAINAAKRFVIAVDIPSGLDGTTGEIHGVCVRATRTVTFTFQKKGFLLRQGPKITGTIKVVDIGIPEKLIKKLT